MNLKNNKGSVTIFVLIGLLFMSSFLIISFASNVNRSKIAKEQFDIISKIYSSKTDDESYTDEYAHLREKNKQIMTASVENNNSIELIRTFAEPISNLRIYGNSVQNGTPSPENPIEIESVGKKTINLLETADNLNITSGFYSKTLNISGSENETFTAYQKFIDYEDCTATELKLSIAFYLGDTLVNVQMTQSSELHNRSWKTRILSATSQGNFDSILIKWNDYTNSNNMHTGVKDCMLIRGNYTEQTIPNFEHYGKYKIPVKFSNKDGESIIENIYLDEPLREIANVSDYIDFKIGKVIRKVGEDENGLYELTDPTEEVIDLPKLSTYEDYTKIEVLTEILPSKIEVDYTGYTLD